MLHSFAGGTDGANPYAALTNVNGTLYGTTSLGGNTRCFDHYGCGIVFTVSTSGTEDVFYRFKGGQTDGAEPEAALLELNGTLYGTTVGVIQSPTEPSSKSIVRAPKAYSAAFQVLPRTADGRRHHSSA